MSLNQKETSDRSVPVSNLGDSSCSGAPGYSATTKNSASNTVSSKEHVTPRRGSSADSDFADVEAQSSCDTERTGTRHGLSISGSTKYRKDLLNFSRYSASSARVVPTSSKFGSTRRDEDEEEIPDSWSRVTEELGEATWGDVYQACCVHSTKEWGNIALGVLVLSFFLYLFLFSLELLGNSAKVIGGCTANSLMGDVKNPIAGLVIGVLATVLLQSSSTTIAIIVSMVGDENGGGGLDIKQAIYMVMGANIGTSVTGAIVALAHLGHGDELERAFAGATVHEAFKFLCVLILLPIEAATGYLYHLTKAMVPSEWDKDGEQWEGPIKAIVAPLGDRIIYPNKDLLKEIAKDESGTLSCNDYYPVDCPDGGHNPCEKGPGLIGCTDDFCPAFFQNGASKGDDMLSGGVCLFLSIVLVFFCLFGLVAILAKLMMGASTRIIYKATDVNGYVAMLIGCAVTVLVQSSSITTSTLTPLVGLEIIRLDQMYPLTLGANVGTTVTGLMAAMVATGVAALQVALAHLFFNVTGILMFYPIPATRRIPLTIARKLGRCTRIWRGFAMVYIVVVFFIIPLVIFGISMLFEQGKVGFTVLGSFFVILFGILFIYFLYWWRYKDGKAKIVRCMKNRQKRKTTMRHLPDDIEYLNTEVPRLVIAEDDIRTDVLHLMQMIEQAERDGRYHESSAAGHGRTESP